MSEESYSFFAKRPALNKLCHVVLKILDDLSEGVQVQVNHVTSIMISILVKYNIFFVVNII